MYISCLFRILCYVNSKTCYPTQALSDTLKISEGRYRWIWKCIDEFMRVFVLCALRQQTRFNVRVKAKGNFL
jgi:hypothetical protein